jgi:hypothetical protein
MSRHATVVYARTQHARTHRPVELEIDSTEPTMRHNHPLFPYTYARTLPDGELRIDSTGANDAPSGPFFTHTHTHCRCYRDRQPGGQPAVINLRPLFQHAHAPHLPVVKRSTAQRPVGSPSAFRSFLYTHTRARTPAGGSRIDAQANTVDAHLRRCSMRTHAHTHAHAGVGSRSTARRLMNAS